MTNITGFTAPGFEPVADAFQANFDKGLELGSGFAAYLGDDLVVDLYGGWMDRRKTNPFTETALVPVFSTTKAISALVVCMEIFDRLDVEAPYDVKVADVWPEFAAAGKQNVTIGQMISHQAGLPGFAHEINPDLWFDTIGLAAELAATEPMWTPGDGSGYHPLTWGYLVGELIRRISPKSLGQILQDRITNADGRDPDRERIDFWIGTPEAEHPRTGDMQRPTSPPDLKELNAFRQAAFLNKWSAPQRGGPEWKTMEIPSANGHGTARAVARIYGAYANQGRIGDRQLFTHDGQFDALTRRRSLSEDRVLPFTMEFAAGVMRNNNLIYGPNPETLAHAGWGGSCGFGDPDRGLSVAYVMNRQSNQLQTDERAQSLISALYGCL